MKTKFFIIFTLCIVNCDPEVVLHHICQDKFSLNSPFNEDGLCQEKEDKDRIKSVSMNLHQLPNLD